MSSFVERSGQFAIDRAEEVKMTFKRLSRREFLKSGIIILAGLGTLEAGSRYLVAYDKESNRIEGELDDTHPHLPQNKVSEANEQWSSVWEQAEELARQGDLESISRLLESREYKDAYATLVQNAVQNETRVKIKNELLAAKGFTEEREITAVGVGAISLIIASLGTGMGLREIGIDLINIDRADREMKRMLNVFHPEWAEIRPSPQELRAAKKAIYSLPPISGKIPVTSERTLWPPIMTIPSLSAEEHVNRVIALRQKEKLGKSYIHQITIQGRLPDEFKYAALALILTSPYPKDWKEPFFEAPWGTIAPLVHDGGRVNVTVNPYWKHVRGRTDFLQRIVLLQEPELEKLEQLSLRELSALPVERLARARAEQMERERMLLDTRFYQRLALALHAKLGNAPKEVPKGECTELENIWHFFKGEMDAILAEHGIQGAAEVRWFTDKPNRLDFNLARLPLLNPISRRYEADWPPIQKELLHLEHVRWQHIPIQRRVAELMRNTTEQVDRAIGLGK